MNVRQANKANMNKKRSCLLNYQCSNLINEITILQYGMSMNFYNKLGGAWVIKVLDIRSQIWKCLMKKYYKDITWRDG